MTILIAVLFSLNAICITFDKLTLKQEKEGLYLCFLNFWIRIDSLKIPDIPNNSAKKVLRVISFLIGKKKNFIRFLLSSVILSFLVTTLSVFAGMYFTQGIKYALSGTYFYITKYPILIYSINFVFDLMTILLALFCLKQIINGNLTKVLVWSLLFISFSFLLSFACYITFDFFWHNSSLSTSFSIAKDAIDYAIRSILFLKKPSVGTHHTMWGFYALSTFIPLFIYWSILLFTYGLKIALNLMKRFLMRILSVILENDPINKDERSFFYPFSTFGVLFSLFGAIFTLLKVLF